MKEFTNMYDYMRWRGDLLFSQDPINNVDSLALTMLSYIEFESLLENEKRCTLGEAVKSIDFAKVKGDIFAEKRFRLVKIMGETERFSTLVLHDYIDIIDDDIEMQFSAISIKIDDNTEYVAYRGTDSSIIGWKEDFNMAFISPVPSQIKACKYLENIYNSTKSKLYVGGHSKGGNLSVYASTMCSIETQENIINAFSFDGPGFDDNLLNSLEYKNIKNRILSFVPSSSIVGMLLAYHDNYTVVESNSIGIFQHDALSWSIVGKNIVEIENRSSASQKTDIALHEWLNEIGQSDRKRIIETIYSVFSQSEATTVSELKSKPQIIFSVIDAINDLSNVDKKNIMKIIKLLFSYSTNTISDTIKKQLNKQQIDFEIANK